MRNHEDRKFSRGLVLGLAMLCCSAALIVVLVARGGAPLPPSADAASAAAQPRWTEGAELAYQFRATADMELTLEDQPRAQQVRSDVEAWLRIQVFEVAAGAAQLGVQFDRVQRRTDGEQDPAANRRLETPFAVQVAADGRFAQFEFPRSLPDEERRQLAEWLRTFEVVLAPDARERWAAEQAHENGTYLARYEQSGQRIERRKHRYVAAAGAAQVELEESVLQAEFAAASWLERAELVERLRLQQPGTMAARIQTRATLQRSARPAQEFVAATAAAAIANGEARLAVLNAPPPAVPATPAQRAEFEALLAGLAAAERVEPAVLHALRDLMRAHPELAELVHAELRHRRLSGLGAGIALHALELAANDEARRALAGIAGDGAVVREDRLRALVAISGAGAADAGVRAELWKLHADQADAAARERATTALLALGAIGRAMRETKAADYAALREQLALALQAAPDFAAVGGALSAIGNSGDPTLAPLVEPQLDAAMPAVRARAAHALAQLGDPGVSRRLGDRLRVEPDGAVRAALVDGLAALGGNEPGQIDQIAARIADEPDAGCRLAMARYLTPHLQDRPALRATLADVLARESDQRVQKHLAAKLSNL